MARKRVKTKELVTKSKPLRARKKIELTKKEEETYLERMQIQIDRASFEMEDEINKNDY